jgi:hypothetical protein
MSCNIILPIFLSLDLALPTHQPSTRTTHINYKRYISLPLSGFKPAIPASERAQTQALDHAATGIGKIII